MEMFGFAAKILKMFTLNEVVCLYNEKHQIKNSCFGVLSHLRKAHADLINSPKNILKGKIAGLVVVRCHTLVITIQLILKKRKNYH